MKMVHKFLTIVAIFMSTSINLTIASPEVENELSPIDIAYEHPVPVSGDLLLESHSYTGRGAGRFLAQQKPRGPVTCDKFPRICRSKRSKGPDCCKKQCVDVSTDRLNCGMCGNKCKYTETCCEGHCVNLSYDYRHCGKCNHGCNKGSSCAYGLCSYS